MSTKKDNPNRRVDASNALSSPRTDDHYELVLFVSGTTPNSLRAIANVQHLCELSLAGRHSLTIVDLYQQPELAVQEQIIAAPTLLRRRPLPARRLIGDMANAERILLPGSRLPLEPDPAATR